MTEQLALHERRRQRRAVDPNQRPGAAPATVVKCARKQFFSRAGLSQEQHRRVHRRHLRQPRQRQPQRRALADDAVRDVGRRGLLAEIGVVSGQTRVSSSDGSQTRPQRRVMPEAVHGHGEELGNRSQRFDHRSRPLPWRSPGPHDERARDLLRDENRHSQTRPSRRSVVPAPALL